TQTPAPFLTGQFLHGAAADQCQIRRPSGIDGCLAVHRRFFVIERSIVSINARLKFYEFLLYCLIFLILRTLPFRSLK
ncbi:MAG: hypothetical protein KGM99_02130, partial [Burkholderiales bacterium]|nr:hypothetical protein [Burkholderiales bacterium]